MYKINKTKIIFDTEENVALTNNVTSVCDISMYSNCEGSEFLLTATFNDTVDNAVRNELADLAQSSVFDLKIQYLSDTGEVLSVITLLDTTLADYSLRGLLLNSKDLDDIPSTLEANFLYSGTSFTTPNN